MSTAVSEKRSFYHQVAFAGVLVTGVGLAIYLLAIPAGEPTAPLFVPATVVAFVVAAAIRRTPKALWLPLVGGVPVLAVAAIDPFRLLHPDSFIDFVPAVFISSGMVIAMVGSAIALWEHRHGTERPARAAERIAVVLVVAWLVGVATFSAIATLTRTSTITLPSGEHAIVVQADEDRWAQDTLSIPAGTDSLVFVRNPDWIAHTFSVPEFGIDVYVAPRTDRTIEISAPAAGRYRFECSVTGHERMVGTLRVS